MDVSVCRKERLRPEEASVGGSPPDIFCTQGISRALLNGGPPQMEKGGGYERCCDKSVRAHASHR